MQEVSVLEVQLQRLDHNLATLQALVGASCRLCPIIKSDAYGLGAIPIARRMHRAGIHTVAVYSPAEALHLALAEIPLTTLILMPVRDSELP
ncbi:MAG TPA: alanine racemase, partial [Phycisphaerales bacterium]|nr:alanine racemase [Phycisphaerales bacterium]